jgi:hypothetical protein
MAQEQLSLKLGLSVLPCSAALLLFLGDMLSLQNQCGQVTTYDLATLDLQLFLFNLS